MSRRSLTLLLLLAVVVVLAEPTVALAEQAWPDYPLQNQTVTRGPGWYLSMLKLFAGWFVFVAWVYTADWVGQDSVKNRFGWQTWNVVVFFAFIVLYIAMWKIPVFWAGFTALLLLGYVTPVAAYVLVRNRKVMAHERVMTPDHLRHWFSGKAGKVGVKIATESRSSSEKGPPVKLIAEGADDIQNNANLLLAKNYELGFNFARQTLADAVELRASSIMLDYSQEAANVQHLVDGVWQSAESQEREPADEQLSVWKQIAHLKPEERRARQAGKFTFEYHNHKFPTRITCQGTATGERVVVQIDEGYAKGKRLPDLGMRPPIEEQYKLILETPPGLVIISTPPGEGLTTLFNATIGSMDRYLRSFIALEEVSRQEILVENVNLHTWSAAANETPDQKMLKILREYPDVIVVREPTNAMTLDVLCDQMDDNRTMLISVRAREAAEALLRGLAIKPKPEKFARAVTGVICQRLVRKLCENCKEAYVPTPQLLQQLGIPAGRIEALYRPPEQPESVCPDCGGVGYRGRHAIFELLAPNEAVREAIVKTPRIDVIRAEARKAGMKSFQAEGIHLVARGITSLEELRRVLTEKGPA
ncbi:MAG: ATPase, T2SS/T4P/T4SS family [Planctomycetia bacterium]|nr:ATPase, T2SS/T4P/T4SS family [Planctomycetia bacterium]